MSHDRQCEDIGIYSAVIHGYYKGRALQIVAAVLPI